MTTGSNQPAATVFFSAPEIQVRLSSSPSIALHWSTSPEIRLISAYKAGKTPNPRKLDALTVVVIPKDTQISGWRLKSVMLVQVHGTRRQSVATIWLEGMAEYGEGRSTGEAIEDLVISLGEYRESLENQQERLGGSALMELTHLRNLIDRSAPGQLPDGLPGTA